MNISLALAIIILFLRIAGSQDTGLPKAPTSSTARYDESIGLEPEKAYEPFLYADARANYLPGVVHNIKSIRDNCKGYGDDEYACIHYYVNKHVVDNENDALTPLFHAVCNQNREMIALILGVLGKDNAKNFLGEHRLNGLIYAIANDNIALVKDTLNALSVYSNKEKIDLLKILIIDYIVNPPFEMAYDFDYVEIYDESDKDLAVYLDPRFASACFFVARFYGNGQSNKKEELLWQSIQTDKIEECKILVNRIIDAINQYDIKIIGTMTESDWYNYKEGLIFFYQKICAIKKTLFSIEDHFLAQEKSLEYSRQFLNNFNRWLSCDQDKEIALK